GLVRARRRLQPLRLWRPLLHRPRRRGVLCPPPQRSLGLHSNGASAPAGRRSAHEVLQGSTRPGDEGGCTTGCVWRVLSSWASKERAVLAQRREPQQVS